MRTLADATQPWGNMRLNRPHFKIITFFTGLLLICGVFLATGVTYYLVRPGQNDAADRIFCVREGMSLKDVVGELEKNQLITGNRLFLLCARVMGYSKRIKAGEYRLTPDMSPLKILDRLGSGAIITHAVTIPEGFTREKIGGLLARKELVNSDEFMALTGNLEAAKRYGIDGPDLEGYLYPDTYHLSRGLSTAKIVEIMVGRFFEVYKPLGQQAEAVRMTMEKVVTLASIVEKETGCASERPIIASVFLNRLQKRMRLESDPTVIYGLKDFDGNIRKKHLSQKTRYNTYVIRGLPPGPIASPGFEALKAVLFPAKTNYLYFVSKNDGTHFFSQTYAEHSKAVKRYQKNRHRRAKRAS
jgi:UPF0755 protein